MTKQAENLARMPAPARYKADNAVAFVQAFESADFKTTATWITGLRNGAAAVVAEMGLPISKLERWKYTNIQPAVKGLKGAPVTPDLVYKPVDNMVMDLASLLSADTPEWLKNIMIEKPHGTFRYADMMMWELCNMFTQDGVVIDVAADNTINEPVVIDFNGKDGEFTAPRSVIRLGERAELTIIENHTGNGHHWNNVLTQIKLAKGAKLRHYRLQENSRKAVYTQNTHVDIADDAQYEAFTMSLGSMLTRNQIHAEIMGENADCDLYGVNLLEGGQVADSTFEVEHMAENCSSNQFVRSVIRDQARGIFQGKVYVHEGADGTDGYQLSNALLLNEGAEMDTKPELEIYADAVKCSHGATTGQLDEEPLFYLRSRGLSEEAARALMIEAFVNEVAEKLADDSVKEIVLDKVSQWLKR